MYCRYAAHGAALLRSHSRVCYCVTTDKPSIWFGTREFPIIKYSTNSANIFIMTLIFPVVITMRNDENLTTNYDDKIARVYEKNIMRFEYYV